MIDDALRFAARLVAVSTRALGGSVAAVILHGSLVLDDSVAGRSNIDLLVIVDRALDSARMDGLAYELVAEQPSIFGLATPFGEKVAVAAVSIPFGPREAGRGPNARAPGTGRPRRLISDRRARRLIRAIVLAPTTTLLRFAYNGSDGCPRVIPIGFYWNGNEIVVCTAATAPKVKRCRRVRTSR
jgi:predicted nucleotidyltransferase